MEETWECIVVGGGAAGLSAALVLGRARRRTLVVDAGGQSNLPAHGIGGLLGHDGRPPSALYSDGRRELAGYPSVTLRDGVVVAAERDGDGFALELADGSRERAARVLLATGMQYEFPALDGIAERWGGSVFHCPFCHGWEVRDRPLAVLDGSAEGVRRVLLLRTWSDDVTLLTDGAARPAGEDAEKLEAAGIRVDDRPVHGLVGEGAGLDAIAFDGGGEIACEGLLVPVTMRQRTALPQQLGAAVEDRGGLLVDALVVDGAQQTSVPGLFAAGDVAPRMPSVAGAIAAGSLAAASIVHGLTPPPAPEYGRRGNG